MSRESNKKYPDEYLLKDSFWREFGIVLGVILLVCLWTSIKPEEYFFELCFFQFWGYYVAFYGCVVLNMRFLITRDYGLCTRIVGER